MVALILARFVRLPAALAAVVGFLALGAGLAGGPGRRSVEAEPVAIHRSGPVTIEVFSSPGGEELRLVGSNVSADVVDLTVTFTLENMRSSVGNRLRVLLAASRVRQPLAVLERENAAAPFRYSFRYAMYYGDPLARNTAAYAPPIAPGARFIIANAFHGAGAHAVMTPYAVDIPMPIGTPVFAARSGIVVRVRSDSDRGGPDQSFAADGNFVTIRHEDGTYGNYAHFRKDGVHVRPGQLVIVGTQIGFSGNTGWSTGPHLHFDVAVADGNGGYATVPWMFHVGDADVTPVNGLVLFR